MFSSNENGNVGIVDINMENIKESKEMYYEKMKEKRLPSRSYYQTFGGGASMFLVTEKNDGWVLPSDTRKEKKILRWKRNKKMKRREIMKKNKEKIVGDTRTD